MHTLLQVISSKPAPTLHLCPSQPLATLLTPPPSPLTITPSLTGSGAVVAVEDVEEGCEVNGRVYRDGEVFQPSCKLQCRCLDGGFTCVPLCQEDVRLPTPDCPHPRRVDIPGKCCPEWVCEAGERLQDARAGKRRTWG